MKLLDLFRSANSEEKALDDNPYLNARRTLNEYNGALIQSRHMWQAAALLALMVAIGAVGGVIYIGSQSKFVPYVIEVDKLGQTAAVRRADRAAAG